jgi:hypothetical protein
LAFHFSLSLTSNCRNWSPNYSVLVFKLICSLPLFSVFYYIFRSNMPVVYEVAVRFGSFVSEKCPPCVFRFRKIGLSVSPLEHTKKYVVRFGSVRQIPGSVDHYPSPLSFDTGRVIRWRIKWRIKCLNIYFLFARLTF